MKFWKYLRWIASLLFIAVLLVSWMVQTPSPRHLREDASDPPQSPSFR